MKYEAGIDLRNANTSHTLLVELVGRDRRVLDVGCAAGDLGRALRRRGCRVAGVELDPVAAEAARGALDEVLSGDVDELDLVGHFGKESFDVVVLGDVLEHLPDPVAALRRLRPLLAPEGSVVASIPNVAHGAVRLALLGGRFDYRPLGLLDATHLRFFTRASVYETFREAGLVPVDVRRTTAGVFETEIGVRREDYDEAVVDAVEGDPESTTYQFVLRAVAEDGAEAVAGPAPGPDPTERTRAHVALCADWAPADLATALAVRVLHAELTRRLPGATVRVLTTAAEPAPSPHDGGLAVEPLGRGEPPPGADCVVVTGDLRGPGPPAGAGDGERPVVWTAVRHAGGEAPPGAAVVDETSVDPSARPPARAVEAVPDPLLLVPRLLPAETLARRLRFARAMGWFPPHGAAVVVEVADLLVAHAGVVARALDGAVSATGASVVLVAMGPGDEPSRPVAAVADAMATPAYLVPNDALVDDVVAVVASASAVVACSPPVMALAMAYGVPVQRLDAGRPRSRRLDGLVELVVASGAGAPSPGPPAGDVEAMRAALDAHLDRVAAVADAAAAARLRSSGAAPALPPAEYVSAMALAHERMRQRLAAERLAVAEVLEYYEAELGGARDEARRVRCAQGPLEDRLAEAAALHEECRAELGRVRAELEALRNIRVLRLLRPARAAYARLRGGRL